MGFISFKFWVKIALFAALVLQGAYAASIAIDESHGHGFGPGKPFLVSFEMSKAHACNPLDEVLDSGPFAPENKNWPECPVPSGTALCPCIGIADGVELPSKLATSEYLGLRSTPSASALVLPLWHPPKSPTLT
jgi:hypothetical protein